MFKPIKAKENRTTAQLPVTYRKLFCFTYKTNLNLIFKISLIISLFSIPFIFSVIMKGILEAGISYDSSLSEVEINASIIHLRGIFGFVVATCFLPIGVGLAGCFYVMKQFLTNEGLLFKRDFKKGIKKNWKGFLGLSAIFSYSLALANYILNLPSVASYYGVLLIIFVIISFIFLGVYFISLNIYQTYTVPFLRLIKNSFLVFISQLPNVCLSLICSLIPLVIIYFINIGLVQYIGWLVYICIGFGHSVLTIVIFNLYILDETVNKKQFKEIYRKGLFDSTSQEIVDEGFKDGTQD